LIYVNYYNIAAPAYTRRQILAAYADYADAAEQAGDIRGRHIFLKPIVNLFHNQAGGRLFRQRISEIATAKDTSLAVGLRELLNSIPAEE
jgi:hypothetical protein